MQIASSPMISLGLRRKHNRYKAQMRYVWKLPLIVGTVLLAEFARADTTQDYVEMTCDPGQSLLSVRYVTVEDGQTMSAVDAQRSDKARLFDPVDFKRTCKLPGGTYTVKTEQRPRSEGRCGYYPTIYMTLWRNSTIVMRHVAFGSLCSAETNLKTIEIADPKSASGRRTMNVCLSPEGDDPPVCADLSGQISKVPAPTAINQMRLGSISERAASHWLRALVWHFGQ